MGNFDLEPTKENGTQNGRKYCSSSYSNAGIGLNSPVNDGVAVRNTPLQRPGSRNNVLAPRLPKEGDASPAAEALGRSRVPLLVAVLEPGSENVSRKRDGVLLTHVVRLLADRVEQGAPRGSVHVFCGGNGAKRVPVGRAGLVDGGGRRGRD